ncbi:hypothetical protein [Micromonospora chersina]
MPTGRRLVVVAVPCVSPIALTPAAVVGVLTSAMRRLVVADVAARVVRRPFAGGAFSTFCRVCLCALVGRLMYRPGVLSVAAAALGGGLGGIAPAAVVCGVPFVGVLLTRQGMAGRSLVG